LALEAGRGSRGSGVEWTCARPSVASSRPGLIAIADVDAEFIVIGLRRRTPSAAHPGSNAQHILLPMPGPCREPTEPRASGHLSVALRAWPVAAPGMSRSGFYNVVSMSIRCVHRHPQPETAGRPRGQRLIPTDLGQSPPSPRVPGIASRCLVLGPALTVPHPVPRSFSAPAPSGFGHRPCRSWYAGRTTAACR
jgi:hypothetical protein